MPHSFQVFAPAKVNLFLHVTGKRADGYHTLQSLMVFADAGDALSFGEHEGFIVETAGPFADDLPKTEDNLIDKAARLLAAEYAVPLRGKIVLTKNLPVASGLGGGSADAAAALRGLARLWDLPEEASRLRALGLRLGADLPACIGSRAVFADGIGEVLTAMKDMPALHLVLVNPRVSVPTAEVFKKRQGAFSEPLPVPEKITADFLGECRNDLTQAAIAVAPEIGDVLRAVGTTNGCLFARMSGSGATCFGFYEDAGAAGQAANVLTAAHPAWWIRAAKVI